MRSVITMVMTAVLYPLCIWIVVGRNVVVLFWQQLPYQMWIAAMLLGVNAVVAQRLMKRYGPSLVPTLYHFWFNIACTVITTFLFVSEADLYRLFTEMKMMDGGDMIRFVFCPALLASFTTYVVLNFFHGALNHPSVTRQ